MFPFDRARDRANWAKTLFVLTGVIGCAMGATRLALDVRWLQIGDRPTRELHILLGQVGGLLLGFIFALIISGQLIGRKKETK